MARADLCAADDFDTQARLAGVLRDLGFVADDAWHDDDTFGLGLTRYRLGTEELTVFRDAWLVDVAGPDDVVARLLAGLNAAG